MLWLPVAFDGPYMLKVEFVRAMIVRNAASIAVGKKAAQIDAHTQDDSEDGPW